eukprot:scaffold1401_cov330-Pavlova_lutheri.AAC.142
MMTAAMHSARASGYCRGSHPIGTGRRASLRTRGGSTRVMAYKEVEVSVDKPLGITLGEKKGGGVVVKSVAPGSNGAKAGLKSGDQVIYTSSFFGDELWPADKLGFTRTAIQAKSEYVDFVVVRGEEGPDVKRLPKRPAPKRFGRKLSAVQKKRATHICLDCGYIYALPVPFEEQGPGYVCPQCQAPSKRFAEYDAENDRIIGGNATPLAATAAGLVGAVVLGALLYLGLQ